MFKSIIKKKKASVFSDTSQTEEVNDAFEDVTCKDCQEQGHASKNHYKCKLYKEITADDVGTSKGKKKKTKPKC